MPYYIAEIRLNKTSKNVRSGRKMGKRLIKHLVTILLVCVLISASIMMVPATVGSDQSDLIESSLLELSGNVSIVPNINFTNPRAAEGQKKALCNKINAVINQIKAGAYEGAVNKLKNDINGTIVKWIADQEWETYLVEKVNYIISLILEGIDPVAIFTWSSSVPRVNQTITFDASASYDPDGWIVSYAWDFGDGTTEVYVKDVNLTATTTHVYTVVGTYTVTLTVTDNDGLTDTTSQSITVTLLLLPVASFTWSPPEPVVNETVTFNATESYDLDGYIVSYLWTFGDGATGTGKIVEHIYASAGTYAVTLFVTDNDGLTGSTSADVTVSPAPEPPEASFTYLPLTPYTDETVAFNATTSYDPDGTIVSYFWDFGDDTTGTGNVTTHAYADDGTYTVTLKVTDNDGLSNITTADINVLNRPPVAIFTESAEIVLTGEVIYFDASESFDPDGDIVSYFWDFGDGTLGANGVTVEHSYARREIYTVTLTVTDDDGATASSNATKTVWNRPPVAVFTESAETVDTGEDIYFNATDSYDPDGNVVNYFWDFGDGTNATGVTTTHSYADNGTYIVTLTVTDDDGATDSANATKMVENRSPVALFTESAESVLTGKTITFNAGDSYDPDGAIASYSWDFGDGTGATGATVNHAYEDDGDYTVALTVTDDDGATASDSATKIVSNRLPVADFTENATTVNTGEAIHFNASESYDPDGSIVSYFWDFGDNTTEIYKGENLTAIATHTYAEAGNYTVTLTVTDDDGAIGNATSIKTVLKVEAEVGWALFAAIGLAIVALIATAFYLWYRRRKKKASASTAVGPSSPQTKPVVTLYVPSGILAGYEEER